jgi:hypothetical protein
MAKERRTKAEVFGDTALDLGKLTFAGIVLAGIFDSDFNKNLLVLCGLILCSTLIVLGVYLITKKERRK